MRSSRRPAGHPGRHRWSLLIAAALVVLGLPTISTSPVLAAPATDGPGALSHFDLARKDCLGTSRTTSSKVWFTVAGGVLSDVYYPTIDNTNVETLQYIVTDGSTFTDLQARDMVSTATALDRSGMSCRVTSTARSGKYSIITDYVTDPDRATLLMSTRLVTPKKSSHDSSPLKLYVRFDPTVNGNGGGGPGNGGADSAVTDTSTGHPIPVAYDTNTATNAANRDYAQPVFAALDGPFTSVTSGFAGAASDGLMQLDFSHSLTTVNESADNGNIVQVAEVKRNSHHGDRDGGDAVTFALSFGATQAAAVATAETSLHGDFKHIRKDYEKGWQRYDDKLNPPPRTLPGISRARMRELRDAYYLSINVVKAAEDKTFPGAIVAGLSSPWGQAVSAGDPNNTYFGSYREVFSRDLYEAWTGLMAAGDRQTARDATLFLFEHQQQADGSMPRNSLVNGKTAPDSFGTQLDEVAYPILMAHQLGLTDASLYEQHIKPAANFVVARGPSFGSERWEEQSGFSPSTIAAEIAGLLAAADIADINGDAGSARMWRAVADDYQRSIKGWTVTTNGSQSPDPYFIRLSKAGDPNAAVSYNVGNGGPTLDQRDVIDAGFLELSRLGMFAAADPDFANSLGVVDATIKSDTDSGPGWHRYNGDGYGDGVTGSPWAPSGRGTGHLWPALTAERAEQSLQTGDTATAAQLLDAMAQFSSGVGLIAEQSWEQPDLAASPFGTDPTMASIGFENGKPAGSASPLVWSAGSFVRLAADLRAGRLVDQPANTVGRYIANTQGQTTLTVDAPADNTAVSGSPLTVSGTTEAGNQVDVLVSNTDANMAASSASTVAAADGSFTVDVPITGGVQVVNVAATRADGATAHATRTVVFDFVPGTALLDVGDPDGDDNGPGNYAYATFGDFQPGAWDMQRFQVFDDGTNIIFRVQNRNQSPTFGSPLGAQLIDVYVHDPAAASTTTAAAHPFRNFHIAPDSAWSTLIQVQGFGQRFENASGTTLGTVNIRANSLSRFITFSVPKAALGQPGPGWKFTVVETGQDGFSPDQARSFAATPQDFAFGVCAAASADPHCTADPNTVPKVIDVLTPAGVLQSDELDYTLHSPVTITGVGIP
ncbi:MAG: glucodextranase DOMON-like domain-containing protein [Ilumatobacteraceae bacterium]